MGIEQIRPMRRHVQRTILHMKLGSESSVEEVVCEPRITHLCCRGQEGKRVVDQSTVLPIMVLKTAESIEEGQKDKAAVASIDRCQEKKDPPIVGFIGAHITPRCSQWAKE